MKDVSLMKNMGIEFLFVFATFYTFNHEKNLCTIYTCQFSQINLIHMYVIVYIC